MITVFLIRCTTNLKLVLNHGTNQDRAGHELHLQEGMKILPKIVVIVIVLVIVGNVLNYVGTDFLVDGVVVGWLVELLSIISTLNLLV